MGSLNAKRVGEKVSESIRKGKKVNLGKIIRESGYSDQTSKSPQRVTQTDSFKEVIDPVVKAMEEERDAAIAMAKKSRNKAKYRDLIDAVDKLTKNIQLLTGGKTEENGLDKYIENLNLLINTVKNKQ